MPSRRDMIRMSDEEVRDFLDAGKTLQLATINKDGTPHLVAMWYGLLDGKIVTALQTGPESLSGHQIAFTALFTDGSEGIFVDTVAASPVPVPLGGRWTFALLVSLLIDTSLG